MMARGLFLDLDGTLANSGDVLRESYVKFLDRHGRGGDDKEFSSLIGPPLLEVVKRLKKSHCLHQEVDELIESYRSLINQSYDGVEPVIGASELLRSAREHKWVTGVVTSNNRDLTLGWLRRTGLEEWIELVVAAEDVSQGKPSPDPYLKALSRGACDAGISFAVEDSPQGAWSATGAGLRTFAIAKSLNPDNDWPPRSIFVSRLSEIMEVISNG